MTQGGEILPYGATNLVFKDGNETVEDQAAYYAYLNQYIKDNNIPGVRFSDDDNILPLLDNLDELLGKMIQHRYYMESGTQVIGDISPTDNVEIQFETDPNAPVPRKRRNTGRL